MVKAILVTGPEGSGTRLLTRLVIECGYAGDAGHVQRWDDLNFPPAKHPIVFRRSLPHGGSWPDLDDILGRWMALGYEPLVLATAREPVALARSQVAAGHVSSEDEARRHIYAAYAAVGELFCSGWNVVLMPYEGLVVGHKHLGEIFRNLGICERYNIENIYNGNEKHYHTQKGGRYAGE